MRLQKKNVWKVKNEKYEELKTIYQNKKEVNEQFGRTMNQGVGGECKDQEKWV